MVVRGKGDVGDGLGDRRLSSEMGAGHWRWLVVARGVGHLGGVVYGSDNLYEA